MHKNQYQDTHAIEPASKTDADDGIYDGNQKLWNKRHCENGKDTCAKQNLAG